MPGIYHSLFIAAPPQLVYEKLTSQQGLAAWWTPNAITVSEINSIARFGFADGYFKEMKIAELMPSELVKWICLSGTQEWIGTSILFTMVPVEAGTIFDKHPEIKDQFLQSISKSDGTILTLRHDHWRDDSPMFAECNYTWALFLRSLKLLCETGKGRPWPGQHSA